MSGLSQEFCVDRVSFVIIMVVVMAMWCGEGGDDGDGEERMEGRP